jgi:hypothetical protein
MQTLLVQAQLQEAKRLCHAEATMCSAASDKERQVLQLYFHGAQSEMVYIQWPSNPPEPQRHLVGFGVVGG